MGYNNNPNVLQLAHAVKSILCIKTKDIVTGNCTVLENDFATRICAFKNISSISDDKDKLSLEEEIVSNEDGDSLEDIEALANQSAFKQNVVAYIGGYVCRKLSNKLSCPNCISNLCPTLLELEEMEPELLLIKKKTHGGLLLPSKFILHICKLTEEYSIKRISSDGRLLSRQDIISSVTKSLQNNGQLFISWRSTQEGIACNHSMDLARMASEEYAKVRLHHAAKQATLHKIPHTKRNVCTRTVVLSGN